MKHFFNTKEEYLTFRKIWTRAVKSPRAKTYLIPADELIRKPRPGSIRGYAEVSSRNTGVQRMSGWITSAHVVLYNIIRNKPLDNGFTDITNFTKIANNDLWYDNAFSEALTVLKVMTDLAKEKIEDRNINKMGRTRIMRLCNFLEPFGTSITPRMLSTLDVPDYNSLERKKGISYKARAAAFKQINKTKVLEAA